MNFFTKVPKQHGEVIELADLDRMREYKMNLIFSLVYEPPQNLSERKKIANEAATIELWLMDYFKEFINDNNRKLAP